MCLNIAAAADYTPGTDYMPGADNVPDADNILKEIFSVKIEPCKLYTGNYGMLTMNMHACKSTVNNGIQGTCTWCIKLSITNSKFLQQANPVSNSTLERC